MAADGETDFMRDYRHLLQATKTINSVLSVDEQLPLIIEAVVDLTAADRGLVLLYDAAGHLEVRASSNARRQASDDGRYSRGVIDSVLATGQPRFILDTDLDQVFGVNASVQELQLRSLMCAPLRSKSGILGALYIDSISPLRAFNEHQKEIFCGIADHAAIALENARLYELSISDPMTGLYNHAYCQRRLHEELQRASRYGRQLSFLLVDVDRFKQINDTGGHRRGDEVLNQVATAIRQTIRGSDLAARYGGDEFAVIAPETAGDGAGDDPSAGGAIQLAERLRAAIALAAAQPAATAPLTVSIGVATFPGDGASTHVDLIELADRALYLAKRSGRDRVCTAPMLSAAAAE